MMLRMQSRWFTLVQAHKIIHTLRQLFFFTLLVAQATRLPLLISRKVIYLTCISPHKNT